MEVLIQILMLFIIINSIIKLSFWKPWQAAIFSVVCGLFVIFTNPYTIEQSKTQIADFLNTPSLMQDMAVLVTIEAAICFAFCITCLREVFGKKNKPWVRSLYVYVSLLIFPILFFVQTDIIFSMAGTSFKTISYVLATVVIVGLPLLALGIKYLVPEKELRLEVHFLVSLFVCILGLLCTVNGNVTYAATEEAVNIKAIGISISLFLIAFVIGFFGNRIKWIIKQNKLLKNKNK